LRQPQLSIGFCRKYIAKPLDLRQIDQNGLAILVQQLRSQTPTEPVNNSELTQQMASMSSVQQQQELNDNLLELLDYQGLLARLQGLSESSALIGKEVSWVDANGLDRTGVVDSVRVTDSGAVRVRSGETEFDLRDVTGISSAGSSAAGGEAEPADATEEVAG